MHSKPIDILVWEVASSYERELVPAAGSGLLSTAEIKHIFLKKLPDKTVSIFLIWKYSSEGVIDCVACDCICLDGLGSAISDTYIDTLLYLSFQKFAGEFDYRTRVANLTYELPELLPYVVETARRQILKRLPCLK